MDFVGELLLGFIVRFLRDEGVAVRGCGTIFFREGIPPAGGKNWPRRASTIYGMFIDRGGAA